MESDLSLIEYNARFLSSKLGRFIQPDTIIPNLTNSQDWNRYSYVLNSPIMYVDPSGHFPQEPPDDQPWLDGWFTPTFDPITDAYFGIQFVDLVDDLDYQLRMDPIENPPLSASGAEVYEHLESESYLPPPPYSETYNPPNLPEILNPTVAIGYDPSRVDWVDFGVSVFGVVGDAALGLGMIGFPVYIASTTAELITVGKPLDSIDMGNFGSDDFVWAILDIAAKSGRIGKPGISTAISLGSAAWELGKGFYIYNIE